VFSRLIGKVKADFADLKHGTPGRRFIEHHERHRQSEGRGTAKWKTIAYVVAGLVLLVVGALLSLVPGVPGILLGIPAIGLLVARLKFFAIAMDKTELALTRIYRKVRN